MNDVDPSSSGLVHDCGGDRVFGVGVVPVEGGRVPDVAIGGNGGLLLLPELPRGPGPQVHQGLVLDLQHRLLLL